MPKPPEPIRTLVRVNRLNRRIIRGHLSIVRDLKGYVKAGALNAIIPHT
jgi:hypothetical protein